MTALSGLLHRPWLRLLCEALPDEQNGPDRAEYDSGRRADRQAVDGVDQMLQAVRQERSSAPVLHGAVGALVCSSARYREYLVAVTHHQSALPVAGQSRSLLPGARNMDQTVGCSHHDHAGTGRPSERRPVRGSRPDRSAPQSQDKGHGPGR